MKRLHVHVSVGRPCASTDPESSAGVATSAGLSPRCDLISRTQGPLQPSRRTVAQNRAARSTRCRRGDALAHQKVFRLFRIKSRASLCPSNPPSDIQCPPPIDLAAPMELQRYERQRRPMSVLCGPMEQRRQSRFPHRP
jgi:hypothetical protein